MMKWFTYQRVVVAVLLMMSGCMGAAAAADHLSRARVKKIVTPIIHSLKWKYRIPGIAVAVTINGKAYFFNYGSISRKAHRPVNKYSLFEIGSITKTFTTTLAAYLVSQGKMSWSHPVGDYLPKMKQVPVGQLTLLSLATHTSTLPLSEPDNVRSTKRWIKYLKNWKPKETVGTQRIYSNVGVGVLGMVITHAGGEPYEQLMVDNILLPMGLKHTFFKVPAAHYLNYSQGYTEKNKPKRMSWNMLIPAAHGLKSCSADMIRYLQANMQQFDLPLRLQRALLATHVGYYQTPELTQDLAWEQYPYPVTLDQLEQGIGESQLDVPAEALHPPLAPQQNVYINKTGTGFKYSFSAYVAFIPEKKIGIVILANKFYPLEQRATPGYKILAKLVKVVPAN